MSGLVPYDSTQRGQINLKARTILDQLAQSYFVEIEAPGFAAPDWFVQVRVPGEPVLAGYYAETLQEAAMLVADSLSHSAAA